MTARRSSGKKPTVSHENSIYKVVEISTVTNETIEEALNRSVSAGWTFDQIQFVVRDSSRRPCMAFVFFTRPASDTETSASPLVTEQMD